MALGFAASLAACTRTDRSASNTAPGSAASAPGAAASAPAYVPNSNPVAAPPSAARPAAAASERAALPAPSASAGPHFYALSAAPAVVHAGQSVSFAARTSPDVATVIASVSAYKLNFARVAPGRFSLAFAIPPNVPFFFHGTYQLNVTARALDGSSVSRAVTIVFE